MSGVLDDLVLPFPTVGVKGAPTFDTVIVTTAGGREQRIQNRSRPISKYTIGFADGSASQADLQELYAFVQVTQGNSLGFRMQDFLDWQSAVAPGDDALNPTTGNNHGDSATTVFQLQREYVFGGYQGSAGASEKSTRKITRPISGSVQIWESTNSGGTWTQLMSGWTVDTTTGLVTFSSAPATGTWIKGVFQFHVPVRFTQDTMEMMMEGIIGGAPDIELVEILE